MKRLMHCPFCGEDEAVRPFRTDAGTATVYRIVCDVCAANGPIEESMTPHIALDAATERWNNRITHEEDVALRTAFAMT
jgi:Lar family restriction alleviation protein